MPAKIQLKIVGKIRQGNPEDYPRLIREKTTRPRGFPPPLTPPRLPQTGRLRKLPSTRARGERRPASPRSVSLGRLDSAAFAIGPPQKCPAAGSGAILRRLGPGFGADEGAFRPTRPAARSEPRISSTVRSFEEAGASFVSRGVSIFDVPNPPSTFRGMVAEGVGFRGRPGG